jgi:hypothetical protein
MKIVSRKFFVFFCAVALMASCAFGSSDDILKGLQAKVKFQPTPVAQVNNYPSSNQSSCDWLAVHITYNTPSLKDKNGYKWLDDVTIETEILFPAEFGGKNVLALLTGKTLYWSLEMDGKKHQEMMLVPPQIIKRLGGNTTSKSIQSIAVKVSFYTKDRVLLGTAYADPKGMTDKDTAALFEKYSGPINNSLKLENTVLSRDKTPWADVNYDYYDLIKIEKKN